MRTKVPEVDDPGNAERPAGPSADAALIPLPSARVTMLVITVVALLFFAATLGFVASDYESALLARFNSGGEANLPAWFSSALWAWAALLALGMGAAARQIGTAADRRWTLLGLLFALLSIDEAAQLHEQTVGPLKDAVESVTGLSGAGARLLAVSVIAVALVLIALWLLPWLRALSGGLRLRLLLAGVVFVSGSLGLEVVARMSDSEISSYLSPVEELCEMLGVGLLVVTLLPAARGLLSRSTPEPA